ncbi:hypothetical protein PVE_R2G0588 [Pseudomonas veronii 1YdBTEX2]|uniref:Uncharacterized protein n=1 Tax=Pseudomonas veronii 1YdBTEX2 TaxID=1295141 RepID=A0A1D3K8B6_PSEVE|nr:hypothetical protein [Pseudomonas sp. AP19]SBW84614.1 hypothetical protein PVE_R2G0588 [Pseudomonas veronii 1YdBTEX2]
MSKAEERTMKSLRNRWAQGKATAKQVRQCMDLEQKAQVEQLKSPL